MHASDRSRLAEKLEETLYQRSGLELSRTYQEASERNQSRMITLLEGLSCPVRRQSLV